MSIIEHIFGGDRGRGTVCQLQCSDSKGIYIGRVPRGFWVHSQQHERVRKGFPFGTDLRIPTALCMFPFDVLQRFEIRQQ